MEGISPAFAFNFFASKITFDIVTKFWTSIICMQ